MDDTELSKLRLHKMVHVRLLQPTQLRRYGKKEFPAGCVVGVFEAEAEELVSAGKAEIVPGPITRPQYEKATEPEFEKRKQ